MAALRILWPIVALLLAILLVVKFGLAALLGGPSALPPAVGVVLCFYLLFMLEGLQVAGLKIKDLDSDAIEQFLKSSAVGSRDKVFPVYSTFAGNFDGFVTGRQIFVIMTVVANSFLIKSVQLPADIPASGLFNSYVFAFAASTLVPAWISQLLPQFMADRRAISFISLPGGRLVLRLAMLLDQIQLGQPAKVMLGLFSGSKGSASAEHIPIGKSTYHEASLNFYGRAKKQHEISFTLGKPTTVRETITYVFKRGKTEHLDHAIQLSSPVKGDITGSIEMPENVHMQIEARDTVEDELYTYWIKIVLNQALPRDAVDTDEIKLVIEYQTDAYTDNAGVTQTTEFSSALPTESAKFSIVGKARLLKKPKVRIIEIKGRFAEVAGDGHGENWVVSIPEATNNRSDIQLDHPTVGTTYQVEFEAMDVPLDPQA